MALPPSRHRLARTQEQSELDISVQTGMDTDESTVSGESPGFQGLVGRLFRLPWRGSQPADHDRGRELRRAVRAEDLPRIRKMLRDGVGVNESQEASLACIATRRQNLELLEVLIQAGVDINQGDRRNRASRIRTPLQEAARKGWVDGLRALLAAGALVDAEDDAGATALHLAVRSGKVAAAELLLRAGASPSGSPRARMTPLHEASTPQMARLLLASQALLDAPDASGATALHHQARLGRVAMVDCLLEQGANAQATDQRGRNALFFAGGKGDAMGVFERLLAAGVDTQARDQEMNTFLHLAATRTLNPRVLEWLHEKVPDLWFTKNGSGETPYDILVARGFHPLAQHVVRSRQENERRDAVVQERRYSIFDSPPAE